MCPRDQGSCLHHSDYSKRWEGPGEGLATEISDWFRTQESESVLLLSAPHMKNTRPSV